MAWALYLFLLAWPVAEIAAFIQVAHWIGWLGAVAGIILSGMAGMALLRVEGLATATRAQAQLGRGEMPVAELFNGACLAAAGLLLIVPGFLGDLVAIALVSPPVRALLRRWLAGHLTRATMTTPSDHPADSTVIEGEWEVVRRDDEPPPRDPPLLP
jgi:UPF0716 protein FxsA